MPDIKRSFKARWKGAYLHIVLLLQDEETGNSVAACDIFRRHLHLYIDQFSPPLRDQSPVLACLASVCTLCYDPRPFGHLFGYFSTYFEWKEWVALAFTTHLSSQCFSCFLPRMATVLVLWLAVCLSGTWAVDRGNFKTCDQSAFCKWVQRIKKQWLTKHLTSTLSNK